MNTHDTIFFVVWFGHTALTFGGIGMMIVWSIRQGAWSEEKHCARLVLDARIESAPPTPRERKEDHHVS